MLRGTLGEGVSSTIAANSRADFTITGTSSLSRPAIALRMAAAWPTGAPRPPAYTALPLLRRVVTSVYPSRPRRARKSAIGTFLAPPTLTPRRRAT